MTPQEERKPPNGIHVSKVVRLRLRILNVQIAHHPVGLMKMWKKCVKSTMRMMECDQQCL